MSRCCASGGSKGHVCFSHACAAASSVFRQFLKNFDTASLRASEFPMASLQLRPIQNALIISGQVNSDQHVEQAVEADGGAIEGGKIDVSHHKSSIRSDVCQLPA